MPPPLVKIDTPAGDALKFLSLRGTCELGRVPSYDVSLLSKDPELDFKRVLGKRVSVSLQIPDAKPRAFQGYVVRFRQCGMRGSLYVYRAVVAPWLWLLTRRSNCRIFQNKTVEDIVKAIFADDAYASIERGEIKWKVNGRKHPKREYCVQYRESDFNFVSRLLEDEGIYYWFHDEDGKETLIFTDTPVSHEPVKGCESLPYGAALAAAPGDGYVTEWDVRREIETRNWTLTDYDFKNPKRPLKKTFTKKMQGFDDFSKLEQFDFPGCYVDPDYGDSRVRTRADELWGESLDADDARINWHQVDARSNSRNVRYGSLLKLERHPRKDQNVQYLVTRTYYEIDLADYEAFDDAQPSRCECWFSAIDAHQPFAPARLARKPFVQGPQTAVVVGPSGEEIYTDPYGRVKVQFFWDREGKHDENSSCWMRVSHPLAGQGWGFVSLPRIGQEVIVDFLEGDPDQPIIIGRVYNADNMPPYKLTENMTQSGFISRSTKGGSKENYNELRFEDKKGAEQLVLHAEKDQSIDVENDEAHSVGHDRKKNVGHDETTTVSNNRTETVGGSESIKIGVNRTEQVGANESITIGSNRTRTVTASETVSVGLQRTHTVGINETISVGAAQEVTIGAFQMVSVGAYQMLNVGAYQSINIGASQTVQIATNQTVGIGAKHDMTVGSDRNVTVTGKQTVKVGQDAAESIKGALAVDVAKKRITTIGEGDALTVGKDLVIKAAESVSITTGSASITMKKDGSISISGKKISIEGSKISITGSDAVVLEGNPISHN